MIIKYLLLIAVPLGCVAIWVSWATWYNETNESYTFLMQAKPIWKMSKEWIDNTYYRMKDSWFPEYIYLPSFIISILGLVLGLIWRDKRLRNLKMLLLSALILSIAYLLLFFEQFYHHDYYFIELYPMLVSGFGVMIYLINNKMRHAGYKWVFNLGLIVLMVLGSIHCRKEMIHRYSVDAKLYSFNDAYMTLGPILKDAGVDSGAKVISYSDDSPNISLYLMKHTGWTRFPFGLDQQRMEACIQQGASLLVFRQEHADIAELMAPYLKELLIEHDSLQVWSIGMH